MNGAMGGNSGTGQVVIKILDINDNIPTLEKESVRSQPLYIYYIEATITQSV